MKLLLCIALACISTPAIANDVVVSFDPAGTQPEAPVTQFVAFDVYFIGQGVGELEAWEMKISVSPLFTVLSRTIPSSGVQIPECCDGGNYIIGLGVCTGNPGADYMFASFNIGFFATTPVPQDELVCVAPSELPRLSTGGLAYRNCAAEEVILGLGNIGCDDTTMGCAVLNPSLPCVVATDLRSWSAVKAAF